MQTMHGINDNIRLGIFEHTKNDKYYPFNIEF